MKIQAALLFAFALSMAGPTAADTVSFVADLDGQNLSTQTGSKANGRAEITLDLKRKTVSMTLDVKGIALAGLWDQLVAAPIGPIHFHHYPTMDHTKSDGVVLVFPVPYGANYSATANGFRATLTNVPYADGARLVDSKTTFDAFKASLEGGDVVLNIHTDAFHDGEISGLVVPAEQF